MDTTTSTTPTAPRTTGTTTGTTTPPTTPTGTTTTTGTTPNGATGTSTPTGTPTATPTPTGPTLTTSTTTSTPTGTTAPTDTPTATVPAIEVIDIGRGRTLEIRPTTADDAELIHELYQPMSADDLHRRFFSAAAPQPKWCRQWASVSERGGHGLIAIVHDGDQHTVIGEAGYAVRPDGDGDLAVAVAPGWRGWLGSYLVELLTQHAAAHGIDNLQADVLLENRPMLTILRHRGSVSLEHVDGTVRLTIGTVGYTPSWPPKATGHKLLVAAAGGRWSGEQAANEAGCATAVCSGPSGRTRAGCPVLSGERCPLADHADAIVILLDPDDERTKQLVALHRQQRPGVPIFVSRRLAEAAELADDCIVLPTSGSDTVAHVLSMIGSAPQPG